MLLRACLQVDREASSDVAALAARTIAQQQGGMGGVGGSAGGAGAPPFSASDFSHISKEEFDQLMARPKARGKELQGRGWGCLTD